MPRLSLLSSRHGRHCNGLGPQKCTSAILLGHVSTCVEETRHNIRLGGWLLPHALEVDGRRHEPNMQLGIATQRDVEQQLLCKGRVLACQCRCLHTAYLKPARKAPIQLLCRANERTPQSLRHARADLQHAARGWCPGVTSPPHNDLRVARVERTAVHAAPVQRCACQHRRNQAAHRNMMAASVYR